MLISELRIDALQVLTEPQSGLMPPFTPLGFFSALGLTPRGLNGTLIPLLGDPRVVPALDKIVQAGLDNLTLRDIAVYEPTRVIRFSYIHTRSPLCSLPAPLPVASPVVNAG